MQKPQCDYETRRETFCTRLKTHQRGKREKKQKKRCPTKLFSFLVLSNAFFLSAPENDGFACGKPFSSAKRRLLIFIWHDFYGRVLDRLLASSTRKNRTNEKNCKRGERKWESALFLPATSNLPESRFNVNRWMTNRNYSRAESFMLIRVAFYGDLLQGLAPIVMWTERKRKAKDCEMDRL